jgi:outer membrane protein assembly factor BamB
MWEVTGVGTGYSAVTPTADAIYITGRKDTEDFITSFTHDGKKNWELAYGKSWDRTYPESRTIPTYVDGFLYLVSGQGDIVCVSAKGEKVWSVNHFQKYGASAPRFGISESPLFVDGKIIVTPGGSQTALVAFDAKTGKVVWETESLNEGAEYVNPLLIQHGSRKIIVTMLNKTVVGVNSTDGKILWKVNYAGLQSGVSRVNHTITPLYRDGHIFITSGYDHTAVKLKLSADGTSAEVVWKSDDIDTHHGGVVLLGNQLFASNYQSNTMGKWTSIDWTTGKTLWVNEWHNKGSIISADGMLYLFEEKSGHVGLARPSAEKLDLVSEFRLPTKSEGPYWAHPVIHNGRLYIRHGDYLAVYNIRN